MSRGLYDCPECAGLEHEKLHGIGRLGTNCFKFSTKQRSDVMGYCHCYLVNGQVTAEWIVTDEVAIWKQIHAHKESRAGA